MRAIADRNRSVQMLMNGDGAASQGMPPAGLVELPDLVLQTERVVLRHAALRLNREDPVQIGSCRTPEGSPLLGRCHPELSVELRHVVFPQEPVGCFRCANAGQS